MEDENLKIITNTLIKYSEQLTSLQKDILKLQREVDLLKNKFHEIKNLNNYNYEKLNFMKSKT